MPAIIQDVQTRQVLMLGYQNQEAAQKTTQTGFVWFYSRSRKRLWQKGETSGNTLRLVEARLDCDRDAILYLVEPAGSTCHTGQVSCFGSQVFNLARLEAIIRQRDLTGNPSSYTKKLLASEDYLLAKITEEAGEVVQAVRDKEGDQQVVWEVSDLLYHLLVLLVSQGLDLKKIERELERRSK